MVAYCLDELLRVAPSGAAIYTFLYVLCFDLLDLHIMNRLTVSKAKFFTVNRGLGKTIIALLLP